jgi:hypothetical protein
LLLKYFIIFWRTGHRCRPLGLQRGDALYVGNPLRRALPGPTIAGNTVAVYGIAGNWGAGYGFVDNWGAGYGVAGDVLLSTGSPFTLGILVNMSMCCILSQINIRILYIVVKKPIFISDF